MMMKRQFFMLLCAVITAVCVGAVSTLNFKLSMPLRCGFSCLSVYCKPHFETLTAILCYLFGRVIQGMPSFSDGRLVNSFVRVFTILDIESSSSQKHIITDKFQYSKGV